MKQHWKDILAASSAPPIGNPDAPYTMVEIGDFECPQCGTMEPIIKRLIESSGGKVKLYFINFPLPMHPHAHEAAIASLAAAEQGKYWQMYDMLYGNQDELIMSEIQYNARNIHGFNSSQFAKDIVSPKVNMKLAQQLQVVNNLQIEFTPTVIVSPSDGSDPVLYVGSKGQKGTPGVIQLAAAPPWDGVQAQTASAPKSAPAASGVQ
jgi:protein-disulfide isomerase